LWCFYIVLNKKGVKISAVGYRTGNIWRIEYPAMDDWVIYSGARHYHYIDGLDWLILPGDRYIPNETQEITRHDVDEVTLKSRRQLALIMSLWGAIGLISGGVHFSAFLSTGSSVSLSDAIYTSITGILFLIGATFASKGKAIAILFPTICVVVGLIYGLALGRSISVSLVIDIAFMAYPIYLWRRGALT
jgi:hypothetical protein